MTVNLRSRVSPEPLAEVDGTEWFRICRCPAGALLAANLRARAAAGGCFRACLSWHVLRNAGLGPLRPALSSTKRKRRPLALITCSKETEPLRAPGQRPLTKVSKERCGQEQASMDAAHGHATGCIRRGWCYADWNPWQGGECLWKRRKDPQQELRFGLSSSV